MQLKSLLLITLVLSRLLVLAQLRIQHPRTENLDNPIGLDVTQPRFGWQLAAERRNVLQTAYEIQVATNREELTVGKKLLWASGKAMSDASVWVPYGGPALQSGMKYWWRVRVWDNAGNVSDWTTPAFWQMGLLSPADWKAQWIGLSMPEDPTQPSPVFRKEFTTKKKVASATAYITAQGIYEARINGRRVGEDYRHPAGRLTKNVFNTRHTT